MKKQASKKLAADTTVVTSGDKSGSVADLLVNLRAVIVEARQQAIQAVDVVQVRTCWIVGRHIVEFEQGGAARAAYGKSVLAQVSTQLSAEFGKGFDASNLYKMSQFYRAFPNLDALRLNLSWTHYRLLLRVDAADARLWYMEEAATQHWNTRTYDFLSTILPYGVLGWERLSIFLNFLISKLPAPKEEDLSKGILDAIDMDSYRAEKKATMAIALPDANAEIEPVPTSGGGHRPQPELDNLSNIVKAFNDQFGGLFTDAMRMEKRITDEIPKKVAADQAYQNARKNSDRQNARIEHDKALKRVITALFTDDAQLFKQFQDNESFRHWLTDTVFGMTYDD